MRLCLALDLQDFTSSYFRDYPSASAEPTLVEGSHWREPLPAFGASEVAALLASSCAMRSVDVESQESFNLSATGWSARLADAATTPVNAHFRVQDTSYRSVVVPPAAVAEVDWHVALPHNTGGGGTSPSASSSPAASSSPHEQRQQGANPDTFGSFFGPGSFQDFAVVPGGKSVWLSVSDGNAWVFLIAPTPANVRSFEDWRRASEPSPARTFLADRVDQCVRVVVSKHATLVVPAGWMLAIYSEHGCSLFAGFFSTTVSLSTQLRVLEAEASEQSVAQSTTLAAGWPLADAAPQVWVAVCFYVRQYLVPDPTVVVADLDKHALLHALPALRRWSSTPQALKASDSAAWVPSSVSEAHGILDRLEQSLSNALSSMSSIRSPYEQQRYPPSLPMMMGHSRQQPPLHHLSVSDADYLYPRTSDASDASMSWPMGDSTGTGQPGSGFPDMSAMWTYGGSPEPSSMGGGHPASAAGGGGFYHSDMVASEFASHVGGSANFTFSLPTHSGAGGFPVAPMVGGSDSYLDAMRQQLQLGPALVAPSPGQHPHHSYEAGGGLYGHQPDVLVRHRASCHRCGNLRKKNVRCPQCPHIFCQKCAEKMLEEHGEHIFVDGCPVCKEQCCCGKNRTMLCTRKFHCYKKCPSTKKPSV